MDSVPTPESLSGSAPAFSVCPMCHQPIQLEWYFCPNCGKALKEKPLSTSYGTQAWIYALSIAMPWLAFLTLGYWPGVKYLRSKDENAKQIGIIACILVGVSTVIMVWLLVVWTQQLVQSSLNDVGNISGFSSGL